MDGIDSNKTSLPANNDNDSANDKGKGNPNYTGQGNPKRKGAAGQPNSRTDEKDQQKNKAGKSAKAETGTVL